mmetsp:Transcript_32790/g.48558  ORF Transcript_32790/g.48558 Transcript_32790/m.48558 type:complete len:151 (+) Transcript_32790:108-560(+)
MLSPNIVDECGNGCNNEIARTFGSTQNESFVNSLSLEESALEEFELVLGRLSRCILVDIVDHFEESNLVVSHYSPWVNRNLCSVHADENSGNGSRTDLSTNVKRETLAHNHFDEMTCKFAKQLFLAQLEIARSAMRRGRNAQDYSLSDVT